MRVDARNKSGADFTDDMSLSMRKGTSWSKISKFVFSQKMSGNYHKIIFQVFLLSVTA